MPDRRSSRPASGDERDTRRIRSAERPQMIGRDHALAQLLEIRTGDDPAELRLADEEALKRRSIADLDVGQHSQLFQRAL